MRIPGGMKQAIRTTFLSSTFAERGRRWRQLAAMLLRVRFAILNRPRFDSAMHLNRTVQRNQAANL